MCVCIYIIYLSLKFTFGSEYIAKQSLVILCPLYKKNFLQKSEYFFLVSKFT